MSVLTARNVLPVVTSLVAALFLATAVPHGLVREPALALASPDALMGDEVRRCDAGGRDADACLDEADGKALVEQAETVARDPGASRRAGLQ